MKDRVVSFLRCGHLVGLAAVIVSMLTYVSYENRVVLGRWSVEFFAALAFLVVLWLVLATRTITRLRRMVPTNAIEMLVNAATLCWGTAYLISSLESQTAAARLLEPNLFGSSTPVSSLLEYAALVLLLLSALMWIWRRREARWADLGVTAAALAVTFVLLEGSAKIKAIVLPEAQGFPTFSRDLWERKHVELNTLGFRDTDHDPTPQRGVQRVLLIGDSYTYGVGIASVEDRLGERLRVTLTRRTGHRWEVVNAGRPDSHTLQEIDILRRMISSEPDVVILVYVFNDIDYLSPVTPRGLLTESPHSIWERLHPARILFRNSYAFQEIYVRGRLLLSGLPFTNASDSKDPYKDPTLMLRHLRDLAQFVSIAKSAGAVVGIVPFDVGVVADSQLRERYARFVRQATEAGLPIWSMEDAFADHTFGELTVSRLDRHPNELANEIAANVVAPALMSAMSASR